MRCFTFFYPKSFHCRLSTLHVLSSHMRYWPGILMLPPAFDPHPSCPEPWATFSPPIPAPLAECQSGWQLQGLSHQESTLRLVESCRALKGHTAPEGFPPCQPWGSGVGGVEGTAFLFPQEGQRGGGVEQIPEPRSTLLDVFLQRRFNCASAGLNPFPKSSFSFPRAPCDV